MCLECGCEINALTNAYALRNESQLRKLRPPKILTQVQLSRLPKGNCLCKNTKTYRSLGSVHPFLPRDAAVLARFLGVVILSVRPSVCLPWKNVYMSDWLVTSELYLGHQSTILVGHFGSRFIVSHPVVLPDFWTVNVKSYGSGRAYNSNFIFVSSS